MPVHTQHLSYVDMTQKWKRCRDAFAGTDAIKLAATLYLPMLEGASASSTSYLAYKDRALFYPAVSRTIAGLTGLAFAKPITISDVADEWKTQFDDVTLTGQTLLSYGMNLCQEVLVTGRAGVLVDMPEQPAESPRLLAVRPYWTTYKAEQIVNWRTKRIAGKQVLTLVVLYEVDVQDDPEDIFCPKLIKQYRVLQLIDGVYTIRIWREKKDPKGATTWQVDKTIVPMRRGAVLNFIPFVFAGPSNTDPDIDHPPLVDLVDVNLSHYRTSADQEHGAHYTALPTPYVSGITLNAGETLEIGSGTAWILPDANARAGMVEFNGQGLKSLAELKEEKRLLMATLGARMLEVQKNVQEAAQTVSMRHAGERSALSVLCDTLGQVISIAIRWHLFWGTAMEETAIAKATAKLNPDIMDQLTAEDIKALVAAWQAGAIAHKTLYHNLQWGEWTRPGVEFDEEESDIQDETPDLPDIIPQPVPGAPGTLPQPPRRP